MPRGATLVSWPGNGSRGTTKNGNRPCQELLNESAWRPPAGAPAKVPASRRRREHGSDPWISSGLPSLRGDHAEIFFFFFFFADHHGQVERSGGLANRDLGRRDAAAAAVTPGWRIAFVFWLGLLISKSREKISAVRR